MNYEIIKDGTKVFGEYYGVKFSGVVISNRLPYRGFSIEYTIDLDEKITVFSTERDQISVGGFESNDIWMKVKEI